MARVAWKTYFFRSENKLRICRPLAAMSSSFPQRRMTIHLYSFLAFVSLADASSSTGWCQLAYWELSQRVGRLFPVENPAVNVFAEQPRGDGLCLTTLAMQRLSATPDAVLKARQKIGLGNNHRLNDRMSCVRCISINGELLLTPLRFQA